MALAPMSCRRLSLQGEQYIKLQTFYFPWGLEQTIEEFVVYYNNERYHGSLDNLTPADVYFGRTEEVKTRRERIKQATLEKRRQ